MQIIKLRLLVVALFLASLIGCGGRGGSSGFDAENSAINQALQTQRCVAFRGLSICPTDEATSPAPSIDTALDTQTAVECIASAPSGGCTFTLGFVPQGFLTGTTFQVLSRVGNEGTPWVLGGDPVAREDSGFDAVISLQLSPGQSARIRLAILAFSGAPATSTEVPHLTDTTASYAFVTSELDVIVRTPTGTPTRSRPPTRTATPTETAGPDDCCECPSSCNAPVGGSCGTCTLVLDATCFGERLCVQRTPTVPPSVTPTPTSCFTDNGDGTISDGCTGLMWEKKDQAGGLHDVDAVFPWSGVCVDPSSSQCNRRPCDGRLCQLDAETSALCAATTGGADGCGLCPEGTICRLDRSDHPETPPTMTIWGWVSELNRNAFAGYRDWRIPSSARGGDPRELESIVLCPQAPGTTCSAMFDTNCPVGICRDSEDCRRDMDGLFCVEIDRDTSRCQTDPGCTTTECSCTSPFSYWTASTNLSASEGPVGEGWTINNSESAPSTRRKPASHRVRAVRPGRAPDNRDCCQCEASCAEPVDGSCGDCAVILGADCEGRSCIRHTPTPTPFPSATPTSCHQDNGDGTIVDGCRRLLWEKKDRAGGLHDSRPLYTWAGACSGGTALCQPNAGAAALCANQTGNAVGCGQCASGSCIVDPNQRGATTTIWDWLAELNSTTFAGYDDWRIPTVGFHGTAAELETLFKVDLLRGNCQGECSLTTCSCTSPGFYWSATTNLAQPGNGWIAAYFGPSERVAFDELASKTNAYPVRAVRGGR